MGRREAASSRARVLSHTSLAASLPRLTLGRLSRVVPGRGTTAFVGCTGGLAWRIDPLGPVGAYTVFDVRCSEQYNQKGTPCP
jgi:hypothetical protein